MKSFDDINFELEQLGFEQDKLLRKRGWDSTSSTPGSLWLWTKTIKGYGKMWVDKQTAIYISEFEAELARYDTPAPRSGES